KRIIAQRPQADKIARANVIIMNDGNVEETWKQVQAAWNNTFKTARPANETEVVSRNGGAVASAPQPAGENRTKPGTGTLPSLDIEIRRGMPGNADLIANFITKVTGKPTDRMDIMLAFGQKSYLLAQDRNERVLGLTGWQVENLITRVDEFYIDSS